MESKNLTIMFTDIKGFTQRTSQQSRHATVSLILQHKELLVPIFESRGGKVIKTIGDAFLVVFESPTNSVLAGIELQDRLDEHNRDSADGERLEIRVAINTGEVSIVEGDVYGEPVNVAARLESISEANEIYFTEATYLAMNRSEVPTAEIGYRLFKGIPDKVKIFKVLRERQIGAESAPETGPAPKEEKGAGERKDSGAAAGISTAAGGGVGGAGGGLAESGAAREPDGSERGRSPGGRSHSGRIFLIVMFACMGLGMLLDMKQEGMTLGLGAAFAAMGIARMKAGESYSGMLFVACVVCSFGLFKHFGMTREGIFLGLALGFAIMASESIRRGGNPGGTLLVAGLMAGGGFGTLIGRAAAGFMLGLAAGFALKLFFEPRKK